MVYSLKIVIDVKPNLLSHNQYRQAHYFKRVCNRKLKVQLADVDVKIGQLVNFSGPGFIG